MADTTDLAGPAPDLPQAEVHHEHRDVSGGWLRPTVFGAMDGLVSNFALIAGVAGASSSSTQIALAGWAGLVGGAFSMAAGEYISVQSQNESTEAELAVERHELQHNAAAEEAELAQMYVARGVDQDVAEKVAHQLSRSPEQALLVHAQEELGVDPQQLPSPYTARVLLVRLVQRRGRPAAAALPVRCHEHRGLGRAGRARSLRGGRAVLALHQPPLGVRRAEAARIRSARRGRHLRRRVPVRRHGRPERAAKPPFYANSRCSSRVRAGLTAMSPSLATVCPPRERDSEP